MNILQQPIFYEFIFFNYETIFKKKFLKEITMEYQHSFPELKEFTQRWTARRQIMEIDKFLTFAEVILNINNSQELDMSLVMFSQMLSNRESNYNINHPYRINTKFYESIIISTHKKFIIDFTNYYVRLYKVYNDNVYEELENKIDVLINNNKRITSFFIIIIGILIFFILVILFNNSLKIKQNKQLELGF